ncbi:ATP-binding protein [Paraburkholderia sp. J67]|uniref:ATP-binding protein n=1 Tax=Paraburkholderia sp. J67 TaxID=2805435 RepID=UPI002ABD9B40|nr:ATP-binding protein [Paraburkholderia sp. J67]
MHAQANALELELMWLDKIVSAAMKLYFGQESDIEHIRQLPPPVLPVDSPYTRAVAEWSLNDEERLVLILALAPHVRPQVLDPFLIHNANLQQPFSEFGGHTGAQHRGFWPTAETAAFVLAGDNLRDRVAVHRLFAADAPLRRLGILAWDDARPAEGAATIRAQLGQPLQIGRECLSLLTTGERFQPSYGGEFPAQRISTKLSWSDLVLPAHVRDDVAEIRAWIEHRGTLMDDWGLARQIKPGFRSLFYGPPGTGKTLTATLLGKSTGLDVYRVDLSLVVSKYIGETEKNLSRVFDHAERQNWILFFDEADALFGKRGSGSGANERYANQEVAYLLQRVEDFPGVVILASNLKGNIDEAFARRFQSMIHFPLPDVAERLRLWQGAFAPPCQVGPGCDFGALAGQYELSGGSIVNVLRYAALTAVRRGQPHIDVDDIRQGIRRELRKDGRVSI